VHGACTLAAFSLYRARKKEGLLMMRDTLRLDPVTTAWNTVARFDSYDTVQRAVDQLSDDGFPVERLDIVGRDLQLVERVTGRLTSARAAGAGAISGLWAGLLIGALLALFTTGHAWLGVLLVAAGFGALWGAVFGFAAHAARRGRRDFSSVRAMAAARYDLVAHEGTVEAARTMLLAAGLLPSPPPGPAYPGDHD
jgi:hypothetical protein